MAYACPVCGATEADGEHLADHLALSAVLHGGDHETWLDEHAPEWEAATPAELGPTVAAHAEETDRELVVDGRGRQGPAVQPRELDPETRRAVEAARGMRRSREDDEAG